MIELREDREVYLVAPDFRGELFSEIKPVRLFTTISRQGVVTLWPCKLPGADGRTNAWYDTALCAAELAMTGWVRVVADMALGGYQPYTADRGGTLARRGSELEIYQPDLAIRQSVEQPHGGASLEEALEPPNDRVVASGSPGLSVNRHSPHWKRLA